MPDFRVFAQPSELDPRTIRLDPGESHHLVRVNRARPGDTVVVFDGRGNEWIGSCGPDRPGGVEITVRFRQRREVLPYTICLAQAVPKGKHMAEIVRKATEIGVAEIVPLLSERTIVHLESDREETKLEKWREAALEACKQCGNSHLPRIHPPRPALEFLGHATGFDLKLIASLQPGAQRLASVLDAWTAEGRPAPRRVVWMIGPEGDFTPAELSAAHLAGFVPITLGALVLRCETAAVYALSVLSYELGGRLS